MNIPITIIILIGIGLFYAYLLLTKWVEGLETGRVETWADVTWVFVALIAWSIYIIAATKSMSEITITWFPK